MIWNNENKDKFIYTLKLSISGQGIFFVDEYQGIGVGLVKTNKVTKVSVDTIKSIATITTNTPQGIITLPNIDVQYTNEKTKQFAFITKNIAYKEVLITNDKQLMMRIVKKIINKRATRIEQWKTDLLRENSMFAHTYMAIYDNAKKNLYQFYKILNAKIKH